jgi:hypothetical protein
MTAMSLAQERIEYIRSLPYNSVGTISGIPNGAIPQNRTVSLNGISFNERVLIEYVDDPADGQDTATTSDSNGISSDYKRIKVEYTWVVDGSSRSIASISNIVPRSIETTVGGGTIRINVVDENSQLLPGASVRLINSSSSIDVTRNTDSSGSALFSGAPAGSGYEVEVTGPIAGHDYSLDKTYQATTTNPIPVSAPFSLLEADVSTLTFRIGRLSDLLVRFLSASTDNSVVENFSDLTGVATSTDVVSSGGRLSLSEVGGIHANAGEAYLVPITPATIEKWGLVKVVADLPSNTEYRLRIYSSAGPYTLVSDSDLPGNAAGFSTGVIDISGLDTTTYPSLIIGFTLETTDSAVTPAIDNVTLFYRESSTSLTGASFILRGSKLIGTTVASDPIYKTEISATSDAGGERLFSDLEFDLYEVITSTSYAVKEACGGYPFAHQAGVDGELELVLVSPVANSLRVTVNDSSGQPIPGALVELSRPGYSESIETGLCGQSFFSSMSSSNIDFSISAQAPGYVAESVSDISVDGESDYTITLIEL